MSKTNWKDERFAFEDYTADMGSGRDHTAVGLRKGKNVLFVTDVTGIADESRPTFDKFFAELERIRIAEAGNSHVRGGGVHSYQPPSRREEWEKFKAVWNG